MITDDILEGIHALIPEDFRSIKRGMAKRTEKRVNAIHAYMLKHCVGKANAQPTSTIARRCGLLKDETRDTRDISARMAALTRTMIRVGIPVCSVTGGKKESRGIYLAQTREEVQESVRYITSLGFGDIIRARELSKCAPVRCTCGHICTEACGRPCRYGCNKHG